MLVALKLLTLVALGLALCDTVAAVWSCTPSTGYTSCYFMGMLPPKVRAATNAELTASPLPAGPRSR